MARKQFRFLLNLKLYLVTFLLLLVASHSIAKPMIDWTPSRLEVQQMQGTQSINVVTLQAADDIQSAVVRVVPELQNWVSVSPASIGPLQSGDQVSLNVAINLPIDAQLGTFAGVLQLRQSIPGTPEKTLAKPLPIAIRITALVDDGLPPDPGESGKQTLLGIDSDDDGVRDDIQRYIHFTYSDDKVRAALTEVAKQYQSLLSSAADPDAAFNNATKMARHGECLDYIKGEEAADVLAALRAEVLNTRDRSIAYILYNDTLGGEIILGKPLADWKDSCAFDVDAIGVSQ